jgi:hypothetical protein
MEHTRVFQSPAHDLRIGDRMPGIRKPNCSPLNQLANLRQFFTLMLFCDGSQWINPTVSSSISLQSDKFRSRAIV